MLAMSDTPLEQFIPIFANTGVPVAFLVPTPTGYEKSIMDAIAPVRQLLFDAQVHDYDKQLQGPENKVLVPTHFVNEENLTSSAASLYRPVTKKGDPRIWFSNAACDRRQRIVSDWHLCTLLPALLLLNAQPSVI